MRKPPSSLRGERLLRTWYFNQILNLRILKNQRRGATPLAEGIIIAMVIVASRFFMSSIIDTTNSLSLPRERSRYKTE